jgi:hypothetical protein
MVGKSILQVCGTVLLALLLTSGAAGQRHASILKANVRFLATSTSVHTGEGRNQDVYLIQLTPSVPGGQAAALARLVDEYPSFRVVLSQRILVAESGAMLRLTRDESCDRALSKMPLRTAPGNPTAILPERLGYRPDLDSTIDSGTLLPCYRLVRP